jgi:NitT/TauT family transport system substrate-binding protein
MKQISKLCRAVAAALALIALPQGAAAEDVLKLAIPQKGAWESAVPELGQQAGIFKKHGIVLELRYTADSPETEATVVSGGTDIGLGVDTMAALRAHSRGTPVRIIGANLTGDTTYWYVLASSSIKAVADLVNRTVAYASNGSSSHYDLLDLLKSSRVKARTVPMGGADVALDRLTQNRLDVGWATPPFGVEEVEQGKIRVVARANDVPRIRGKTVSVMLTSARTLDTRKDAIDRFMKAYRETVEWMYTDDDALKRYAAFAGISEAAARRLRDEFYTKGMLLPDQVVGIRAIIKDAITLRYIQFKPSRKQIAELVRTPTPVRSSLIGSFLR